MSSRESLTHSDLPPRVDREFFIGYLNGVLLSIPLWALIILGVSTLFGDN